METLVLVCAVLASLACGVLAAYAVCVAMFHALKMRGRARAPGVVAARVVAPAQVVEG